MSQDDYRTAKRFDLDNNGVLDPEERELTKEMLVEEFLDKNDGGLRCLGELGGKMKKLEQTLRSPDATKTLTLPQTTQVLNQARFMLKMSTRELMSGANEDAAGSPEQRFFTNKLDSTAWNDFDAVPRCTSAYGLDGHGGSRRRMFFTRKQKLTEICQSQLERANSTQPAINVRRYCVLTNPAVENS